MTSTPVTLSKPVNLVKRTTPDTDTFLRSTPAQTRAGGRHRRSVPTDYPNLAECSDSGTRFCCPRCDPEGYAEMMARHANDSHNLGRI